jgi:hypothetical protein
MSTLGKTFLYVALAGLVAAAVGAWMLVQKYHDTHESLLQAQANIEIIKSEVQKVTKEKDTALTDKATTEQALTEAQANATDLKGKLDAAVKDQDDLKAAVQEAKANTEKATEALKQFTDALGNVSPEDAKAMIKKLQDDKTAAETEQKILADQLQALTKQIADIKEAMNKGPDKMSPGISGKVTFVNHAWNFVVLDVGLSNGVIPKGELIVYRGNRFLGKVKVTSVEDHTAVADILPDIKGDIQMGDSVLN